MAQSQKSLSQSQRESRGPVVASKTQLRVERSILLKPQGQISWNIHLISLSCSCLDSAFTVKKKWPKTQSFHLYGTSSVLFQTWPVIHDSHRWDSWTLIYFIHNSLFMSGFVLRFSATLRQWKVGGKRWLERCCVIKCALCLCWTAGQFTNLWRTVSNLQNKFSILQKR